MVEQEPSGASHISQIGEHVHGLNADQILQSSYFNLATTRAPGVVDEMRSLAQRAWDGDTDATIDFLRLLTSGAELSDDAGGGPGNGRAYGAAVEAPSDRASSVKKAAASKAKMTKGATSKATAPKAKTVKATTSKATASKATTKVTKAGASKTGRSRSQAKKAPAGARKVKGAKR
jgi:hypothetical protein